MALATPFEIVDAQRGAVPLSSVPFSVNPDSLYEGTKPHEPIDEYYSRCHWYGEQFHRCVLAEGLFSNASGSIRGENLKSEHMQAIIDFPYSDCVEYVDGIQTIDVPNNLPTGAQRPYALLMTKIGAVLDQGDKGARHKLAVMIQNRSSTGTSVMNGTNKLPPSPPTAEDLAADDDKQIAMYTMKLNEWSQRKGKSLELDDEHISVDPPLWEVNLSICGGIYTGRAKKRKRAQHIASKKACEELMIRGT